MMENILALAPYLACPLVMGGAMWLMMRGQGGAAGPAPAPLPAEQAAPPAAGDRLATLRAQLAEAEAQQTVLAGQIARLSAVEAETRPRAETAVAR